jgi:putative salt-induced outer membrane protein
MRTRPIALALLAVVAIATAPALAEDPPKLGWADTAELSYVQTAGNSETSTFGFRDTLLHRWDKALFTFKIGGIRSESTTVTRQAEGAWDDYEVRETKSSAVTAEAYFANAQYDRKISEHFAWNAGGGWDRNTFAGIQNRYLVFAGVGNVWVDKETVKFKTDYSATYTKREDVVVDPDPNRKDKFAGLRFAWDYMQKFGAATTFTNTLTLDDNVQQTSDWRGDALFAVGVAMSKNLALKVSLRFLYANEPAKEQVELVPADPEHPTVLVPLEELDTVFTTSLVVNW